MSEPRQCQSCGVELKFESSTGCCPICTPTVQPRSGMDEPSEPPEIKVNPETIPGYRLERLIAQGGMGKVFEAFQFGIKRTVALKMLISGEFADAAAIARFRAEAEVIGMLEHPNVMRIYDVGECDGRPFYSMQLVESSLTDLLKDLRQDRRKAVRIMAKVARGVHFVHRNGILHRDLKPANILMDGEEPVVTDFGLAKRIESSSGLTLSGQAMGTPYYMSPEQAAGDTNLTTSTDVYSLGAVYYHILTGRPPFVGDTALTTMLMVREEDPKPPTQLDATIDRDLETICLKCLEKTPTARYGSAEALADEFERWLKHEPITARPITPAERVGKWVRRRPAIAALYVVAILAAVILMFRERLNLRRITNERNTALVAEQRRADAINTMRFKEAERLFEEDNAADAVAYLTAILRDQPTNHVVKERLLSALRFRTWPVPQTAPLKHEAPLHYAEFNADGSYALTIAESNTAAVWNTTNGQQLLAANHAARVNSAQFNRTGTHIVTASRDGVAKVINIADGSQITLDHTAEVASACFSPDGTLVLTAVMDDHGPRLWNTTTGREITRLPLKTSVHDVRFSNDGQQLLALADSRAVFLWHRDGDKWSRRISPRTLVQKVQIARFSPDGSCLVMADELNWETRELKSLTLVATNDVPHETQIRHLDFSPDGQLLVTASQDRTAKVWDATNGEVVSNLKHRGPVNWAAFDHSGKLVVTAAASGHARVWNARHGFPHCEWIRHDIGIDAAQLDPSGTRVVTASRDHTAVVWDVRQRAQTPLILHHGRYLRGASYRPGTEELVTFGRTGGAKIWNAGENPGLLRALPIHEEVFDTRFSPDGSQLLTIVKQSNSRRARLWHVDSGKELEPLGSTYVSCADFSPNNRWIATGGGRGLVRIWTRQTNGAVPSFVCPNSAWTVHTQFSPDAQHLVTCTRGFARLWETTNFTQRIELAHNHDPVLTAAFSHDSRKLATATHAGIARIWDTRTGEQIGTDMSHSIKINAVRFSPDGRWLATASDDFTAMIWDTSTGRPTVAPVVHKKAVLRAIFTPDSRRLITTSADETARIWDVATGRPLTGPLQHGLDSQETEVWVKTAEFNPTANRLATACFDGNASIWHLSSQATNQITEIELNRIETRIRRKLGSDGIIRSIDTDSQNASTRNTD